MRVTADAGAPASQVRAGRLLWASFWAMLASVLVGLPWDAAWHARQPFETAFSPPHLFIYLTTGLAIGLYLLLLCAPRQRRWFGSAFPVPTIPYPVPGSLFLVGAGLAVLGLGAALDVIWHSAFGLDETRWSTPHAMLGWGWGLAALGFVSARLALGSRQPLGRLTRAFLGFILLGFTIGPLVGPFQHNQTPEKVAAVAAIPVLADQPEFQHTARIYLDWRLTRAHPGFVVLGALWAGLAVAALQRFGGRTRFVVLLVTAWTVLALFGDRRTAARLSLDPGHAASWLPIPLLPALLASTFVRRGGGDPFIAMAVGGAAFGLVSQAIWPSIGVTTGALLGAVAAPLGFRLGDRLMATLEQPTRERCVALALVAVVAPLLSGLIDLFLRSRTPWT